MSKEKRFIKSYTQSGFSSDIQIWVDTETGVNYVFIQNGYSGGLTPLLDGEGNPIITPIPTEN